MVRVLARAIAHEAGLEFGRGLSTTEDAALWAKTSPGQIATWIDVGAPSADRLHRASKRAERVLVFTHKPLASLRKEWSSRDVYQSDKIEVVRLPVALVRTLSEQLERTNHWYVTLQDDELSVAQGERNVSDTITRGTLEELLGAD